MLVTYTVRAALLAALAPPLTSQRTVYSPSVFETAAGNFSKNISLIVNPLTSLRPLAWQQLHDAIPAMTIRRLTFRRGSGVPDPVVPYTVDLELDLSTATRVARQASRLFATNHGLDRTKVIRRKKIQFPAAPWARGVRVQSDRYYQLPLDRAFPFGGGTLCWESSSFVPLIWDPNLKIDEAIVELNETGGLSMFGNGHTLGSACPPGSGLASTGASFRAHGSWLHFHPVVVTLVPRQPRAMILRAGTSEWRTRSGVPLPFDLGPLGAPGCSLYTSAEIEIPLTRRGQGWFLPNLTASIPYSAVQSQAGRPFYAQGVGLDPTANALGVVVPSAVRFDIPPLPSNGDLGVQTVRAGAGATRGSIFPAAQCGLIVGFSPR